MKSNFLILPSGIIVNKYEIEYVCGVRGIKQPREKKCHSYAFSIQFIHKTDSIVFSYDTKEDAEADYNCLKELLQDD